MSKYRIDIFYGSDECAKIHFKNYECAEAHARGGKE